MYISVVLASYNGEKYIRKQVESIAIQLTEHDELIVSDDGSTDRTIDILEELKLIYPFIKVVEGPHEGIAANFENAIKYTNCDIILFSDQDDIWNENKVSTITRLFEKNSECNVIMHNASYCDGMGILTEGNLFMRRKPKHGVLRNWIKSTYYGCCMAFRKEFLKKYLPFPKPIIAYDQYLGLCGESERSVMFVNKELIIHRYHGGNQSNNQSITRKIAFRFILLKQVFWGRMGDQR